MSQDTEETTGSAEDATVPNKNIPIIQPLKSALKKPSTLISDDNADNDNTPKPIKPAIKRTVSFAPGLVTGKSDVTEIVSDAEDEDDKKEKNESFDDTSINSSSSTEPLTKSSMNALNFTNWRFGGGFSASETSDDEKDFGKMNEKYRYWSPQYAKQQETKIKMQEKLKQSVRKLRKTKKNIKKITDEIEDEEEEEDEDDDINEQEQQSETTNNNDNKKRKRRVRSHSSESIESTYKKWKKKQNKKGVIYISSVPFGCTSQQIKKIFNEFGVVTNVHLEAAKGENGQSKKIYNKWTEFCEAWIEFKDKKIAKQVVELLHETKIPKKYVKNKLAKSHIWSMKYLKGFGWHHLTEYKQTIRTLQRKKYDLAVADAHRQAQYFQSQVYRAQQMTKNWNTNSNNKQEQEDEDVDSNYNNKKDEEVYYESSDDELPPLKKRKLVQQRSVRKRRNHSNKHLKQMTNKLMK